MNNKLFYAFVTIILLTLTACGSKEQPKENSDALTIYTTVYPLQYFTERIGGDTVNVQSIYPPGADEHTFDPTQKDMMGLADSDLFFYIGLGLEGFVENAEKTMKSEHVKMIPVAETIPEKSLHESESDGHDEHDGHNHEAIDPHVWISPHLSIELATTIKDTLIENSPENKVIFEENFDTLEKDLLILDKKFEEMASNADLKTFFVSHASFGYLADEYGLNQVAVAGLNSQSEPSQKQLATLVEYAKINEVNYVLFEQNISSKLTEVIQEEIGAKSLMLHNLSVLTTEDLENEEDYFSLMAHNIQTLTEALSGK